MDCFKCFLKKDKFIEDIKDAVEDVKDTVEDVKDTVEDVKDTVEDNIANKKVQQKMLLKKLLNM